MDALENVWFLKLKPFPLQHHVLRFLSEVVASTVSSEDVWLVGGTAGGLQSDEGFLLTVWRPGADQTFVFLFFLFHISLNQKYLSLIALMAD